MSVFISIFMCSLTVQVNAKVTEMDTNNDKIIDQKLFYDKKGKVIRMELDSDQNGCFEIIQYYKDELLVRIERDIDQNGHMDCTDYYDKKQSALRREQDSNQDGKTDSIIVYENSKPVRQKVDSNFSGIMDRIIKYKKGMVYEVLEDSDENAFFENIYYYCNGKLSSHAVDKNEDGRPDILTAFNNKEEKEKVSIDSNFDGKMDQFQFYKGGSLQRMELDSNPDGLNFGSSNSAGSIDTKIFYSKGQKSRVLMDKDHDQFFEIRYIYDDPNHYLIVQQDINKDEKADKTEYYDEAGKIIKSCEKKTDFYICRIYNDNEKIIRVELDSNFDGKADLKEYYDDTGAFIKREKDLDFDGIPDLIDEVQKTENNNKE